MIISIFLSPISSAYGDDKSEPSPSIEVNLYLEKEVVSLNEIFMFKVEIIAQNPRFPYKKPRKCAIIKQFWKNTFHLKGENTLTG